MYLEVSAGDNNWEELEVFTGNQNTWTLFTYSLNDYLGEENVIIRFRFYSDSYVTENGMFIDDLQLEVAVGTDDLVPEASQIEMFPNPADKEIFIDGAGTINGKITIQFLDVTGRVAWQEEKYAGNQGDQLIHVNTESLTGGLYLIRVISGDQVASGKIVIR
jgi:hypothetical protein